VTLVEDPSAGRDDAERFVAGLPLFAGLPDADVSRIGAMLRPFAIAGGETLFQEGDEGGRMYAIAEGLLEVATHLPGERELRLAVAGPGELLGELSLLGGGRRSATVRALEPTTGYTIDRATFELLRADLRPAAIELMRRLGATAVVRLRRAYEGLAARHGNGNPATDGAAAQAAIGDVGPERGETAYLARILFFRGFAEDEIREVAAGLRRLAVPRGALLRADGEPDDALLLVLRGALEVTIRGGGHAARVLLAGPGRAAGHLGVLDEGPSIGVCRARERAIVLEIPSARIAELGRDPAPASRRFTRALYEDVARALQQAERPLARMAAHA
jgi:CRP-like cAMP-binding protein